MRLATLSLLLLAIPLFAQRGGFGRGPNPDDSFNKILASYGGSGDVVDYARVPPQFREERNAILQRFGAPPMPTSGTVTRAQFADEFNKRMEQMRAGGGFSRGGPPPAAAPVNGTVTVTSGNIQPAPNSIPNAPPGQPQERQISDEDLGRTMRKYDSNDDGRISAEEAQKSDRWRPIFGFYDTNKDGFVDLNELRVYANDRMNNRGPASDPNAYNQGGSPSGGNNPPPANYDYRSDRDRSSSSSSAEPERPVAIRYGKLPKGLPDWFESLDTDKDGQVGLYEWRASAERKKNMEEFIALDLNADGLLTAEEYLRAKKIASASVSEGESRTSSSRDSRNSKDNRDMKSSKDAIKEEKKDEKRDSKSGNPFRGR